MKCSRERDNARGSRKYAALTNAVQSVNKPDFSQTTAAGTNNIELLRACHPPILFLSLHLTSSPPQQVEMIGL